MAWYKNANNLKLANGTEAVWSTDYKPAETVSDLRNLPLQELWQRGHLQ